MVYSNKFVACVLLNGQPQAELANKVVKIPFGSNYSLRFRNKHDRRAVVQIFMDGENVSGGGYVINAHSSVDIHRHADVDTAFKFVSLESPEAVEHGKNGPNPDKMKGTIEARFFLEKKAPPAAPIVIYHPCWPNPRPSPWTPWYPPGFSDGHYPVYGSISSSVAGNDQVMGTSQPLGGKIHVMNMGCAAGEAVAAATSPILENKASDQETKDGCTVPGGTTGQFFWTINIDTEEEYTSLNLFLQGLDPASVPLPQKREIKRVICEGGPSSKKTLHDLEEENEDLRRKIAEMEQDQLLVKLKALETKI